MKSDEYRGQTAQSRRETRGGPVELDDYHAEEPVVGGAVRTDRSSVADRRIGVRSHELTDDAAEAVSRLLIRVVPLVYAGLLGTLAEWPVLGLLVGLFASLAFDLRMGRHSLAGALVHWLRAGLCPRLAAFGRRIVVSARRRGLVQSGRFKGLRCT